MMICCGLNEEQQKAAQLGAADNVKRLHLRPDLNATKLDAITSSDANPYLILDTLETKTTWHPVGV